MQKQAIESAGKNNVNWRINGAFCSASFLALAGAMLFPGVATAQTNPDSETEQANSQEKPAEITNKEAEGIISQAREIVVVGTRASLQSAINRKKEAGTIVDSIVADDIASFPDKNVGDSLARITGVQLSRDFGEGTQVSIRGVEPDLNRVEINGVSQVSATGTRAGDFREFATELVKSIDVYKGYSVDLTEGGIGGTVRIETRKPLDLEKPLLTGVLSQQHLDTAETWKPRVTFVAGTPKFLIDGLGVLVNVTYSDVDTRQDYISNTNWKRLADFDHSTEKTVADPLYADYDTYESCANVSGGTSARTACETQFFDWAPTVPRYRSWNRHDQRISGDLTLQYQVAPNLRAYGNMQINKRNQTLEDVNYSIDLTRIQRFNLDPALATNASGATSVPRVALGTSTVNENHVVTNLLTALNAVNIGSATAPNYNGAANIVGVQRRDFSYDQDSKYFSGGFTWDIDRFKVDFMGSHATAHTDQQTNLISFGTSVSGITIDRNNSQGIPVFQFPSDFDPGDPAVYSDFTRTDANGNVLPVYGPSIQYRPAEYNNTEDQLKLDVDWDIDHPIISRFQFGAQARRQKFLNYGAGGSRLIDPATGTYQSNANVSYNTIIDDNYTQRRVNNTYYMTTAEYQSLLSQISSTTGGAPLFTGLSGAPSSIPGRIAYPSFDAEALSEYYDLSGFNHDLVLFADGYPQIPSAKITETIYSAYAMMDVDTYVLGMHLTGNAGLRWTHTEDKGLGTYVNRVTRFTQTGSTETVTLSASEAEITNTYDDFLPAFNANLELADNLFLRANYAKNLARPKPTDLVPNINCLDDQTITGTDDVCSAGNPDLKPYRADQWEVNLAWYPNPDTMLSLGYYKKYESTFVIPATTRDNVDLFHDGNTYTVRQPINGEGALLDGIEASAQTVFTFLPKPFDGFGATANMTYARAIRTNLTNDATGEPLTEYPGLSKYTYNASIFYDQGILNARLSYNYRSKWLVTVLDANNGNNPIYRKGEGYLDGKITLRFPDWHFNVFVEMQNITKEYSKTYINADMPVDLYYPGQRTFIGIQAKL